VASKTEPRGAPWMLGRSSRSYAPARADGEGRALRRGSSSSTDDRCVVEEEPPRGSRSLRDGARAGADDAGGDAHSRRSLRRGREERPPAASSPDAASSLLERASGDASRRRGLERPPRAGAEAVGSSSAVIAPHDVRVRATDSPRDSHPTPSVTPPARTVTALRRPHVLRPFPAGAPVALTRQEERAQEPRRRT
jgi:hypothetical protein